MRKQVLMVLKALSIWLILWGKLFFHLAQATFHDEKLWNENKWTFKMYQLQNQSQMNLTRQAEIPYYKITKTLHCRITSYRNAQHRSTFQMKVLIKWEKKKMIIFGFSREWLKLYRIQPIFACGWVLETIWFNSPVRILYVCRNYKINHRIIELIITSGKLVILLPSLISSYRFYLWFYFHLGHSHEIQA